MVYMPMCSRPRNTVIAQIFGSFLVGITLKWKHFEQLARVLGSESHRVRKYFWCLSMLLCEGSQLIERKVDEIIGLSFIFNILKGLPSW